MDNLAVLGSGPKDIFTNTDYVCYFTDCYLYIVETKDTESYINKTLEEERNIPYDLKKLPYPRKRLVYPKMVILDGIRVNKDNVSEVQFTERINKLTFVSKSHTYEITLDFNDKALILLYLKKIFNYDPEIKNLNN